MISFFDPISNAVPTRPYDVAVVIPTVLRPTLGRAVRSVFSQRFIGTVQLLIGADLQVKESCELSRLQAEAPPGRDLYIFAPGYSTSVRHGGPHTAFDGGALRTILSYAAYSRYVAYLDDDNWWGRDHLSSLLQVAQGRAWAYSLRWFVDPNSAQPLGVDRWDSVGPGAGCHLKRFGGWVDPNCLLVDKVRTEPVLSFWTSPPFGDTTGLTADRRVFDWLRHQPYGRTGRATTYYTLTMSDPMYPTRMAWLLGGEPRQNLVDLPYLGPLQPTY